MRATGLAGLTAAVAAACTLSACGGGAGARERLVETCRAEGEAPETCTCIVDALETHLSPDLFKRTAVAVAREQREIGDFILSLPDTEKMEFYAAEQDMRKCDLSPVAEE